MLVSLTLSSSPWGRATSGSGDPELVVIGAQSIVNVIGMSFRCGNRGTRRVVPGIQSRAGSPAHADGGSAPADEPAP